jgi:YfiH family protein
MGIDVSRLVFPSQVHGTRIVRVTPSTEKGELAETDALITNEKGICIAVMSADCVPVLLYDKKNNVVAAVHSGWRGTVAMILSKTLTEMRTSFGTKGPDIVAVIGPSVCQESYEVGAEVVESVNAAFGKDSALLIPQANNKAKLDLWKANEIQLREFGVHGSAIEVSNLCSVKNNDHFFSARKGDSGRFAAGIMLLPS